MIMNMQLWDYTQIWQILKDTSHMYTNSQFSLRNNLLCRYIWKERWQVVCRVKQRAVLPSS